MPAVGGPVTLRQGMVFRLAFIKRFAEGFHERKPVRAFSNPGDSRAGLLNLYIPGGFEQEMPGNVAWFAARGAPSG